jgi:hypothetical protein
MADHKHGSMDITVQEQTFDGFIKFTIKSLYAILFIVFLLIVFGA